MADGCAGCDVVTRARSVSTERSIVGMVVLGVAADATVLGAALGASARRRRAMTVGCRRRTSTSADLDVGTLSAAAFAAGCTAAFADRVTGDFVAGLPA